MTNPAMDAGSWPQGRHEPTIVPLTHTLSDPEESLVDRLVAEIADAWQGGARLRVEDLLAHHPTLSQHPRAALRLIYEEICLREAQGEETSSADWAVRFPQWRAELDALLACHRALEAWPDPPRWPRVGQTLGCFQLVAELGRGGRGRVYLAIQPHLADRPVVLKATPRDGSEHWTLARLQHSHIVPLYTVEDFPELSLRVLCMPYLGGATLAQILDLWRDRPPAARDGSAFVAALEDASVSAPVPIQAARLARNPLARRSYVQVVCWIGACLADALHYAHERGLVHLDLKPSNVLIADDGQPMLLDFHLAQGPIQPGWPLPAWLGGTPSFMAPEHRAALAAFQERAPIPSAVDGRADLYALSKILYEMLGGVAPDTAPPSFPRLDRRDPKLSVGLADVIHKCLARDPGERYLDAAALAADLRRHLADLPLQGVANRSLRERWSKWRRRRPHALGLLLILLIVSAALALAGAGAVVQARRQSNSARAALDAGREQLDRQQYADAIRTLEHGLTVAGGLFEEPGLARTLHSEWRRAQRAEAAHRLGVVADQVRFLHGARDRSLDELRALEASCRAIWETRGQFVAVERTRADLIVVGVLLADVRVRLAPPDRVAAARRAALELLDELEARTGTSLILDRERLAHAEALDLHDRVATLVRHAAGLAPRTAWEYEALGESLVRSGDLMRALAEFEHALDLEPQAIWPHFLTGICAYRLHHYEDALAAFDVCVALAPDWPSCYSNRALVYAALGRPERAVLDYDRVLRLDPGNLEALRHRRRLRNPTAH